MSGVTNAGEAFDLIASRIAAESTYAGIVRLVAAAQHSQAPMARLADRYALGFLALTLAVSGLAWFATGDPIRAVAVLVVATPCPLILAVPIAFIAGLSQAAKNGILIKGSKALEKIAQTRAIVIDKTGTLTHGQPSLIATTLHGDIEEDELLRIAASLDQASKHTVAQTIVETATRRKLRLAVPSGVAETAGEGISGVVEGKFVSVGGRRYIEEKIAPTTLPETGDHNLPGAITVAVAIDGLPAGELILADKLRSGAADLFAELRKEGVRRIVLATGDGRSVAESIARNLGLDAVRWELAPDQKIQVVQSERQYGPVMMVGDGVNDAPALAAADIGMAMGARGSAASAEAADGVLLVDDLGRLLPAIVIAKHSRMIALQCVYAGIGLSLAAMALAAFGHINPVEGALIQEVIDVAVILNALRALGMSRRYRSSDGAMQERASAT
jgi:heavy metal translocating P-type ATPase